MLQKLWKCSGILRNIYFLPARHYSPKLREHLAAFPDVYDQKTVEKLWSSVWFDEGLFKQTKSIEDDKNTFRLLLPPPNITGNLHLGHSLTVAIQDAICRYQRMNGRSVVWYGGTDHAGIATQMLVEKMIAAKYNKSRHNISKDEFENFFEQWKLEKTSNIKRQLEALGASIDFDKSYFTLSSEIRDFVQDSFIELFNRGLIYRASYMVNWSYYLQSTLSDIEIQHKFISKPTMMIVPGCDEEFEVGVMHRFRYPVISDSASTSDSDLESNEYLTIATTRVESLMGDVALAVNPEDSRYAKYIGREAYNPFTRKRMPIIAELEVKMDFGTGVLKLTPAHCDVDAEIAKRHGLPLDLVIFDEKGFVRCDYEKFNGIHRYAAKKLVVEELKQLGLYESVSDHPHWLPLCTRSGDIIEQKQVPQWFLNADKARFATEFVVNRDNLSETAMKKWKELDLEQKNISLIPSGYRNTWRDWFSRYKDWCISRQISWGHEIPAYQVLDASGKSLGWVAAKSETEAKQLGQEKFAISDIIVKKDNDVLDTWFSSALLPIAISKDSPLNLMETGHDILFFWVARMVLMSLLLKNRLPFERILLHGMICDQSGRKMSKSKGNVIDPMDLINGANLGDLIAAIKTQYDTGALSEKIFTEKMEELLRTLPKGIQICGADILRLSLLQSDFKDQKVNFDLQKTLKRRAFVNKMHQTVRFLMMQLDEMDGNVDMKLPEVNELGRMERWIYRQLAVLIQETRDSFESYDLYKAALKMEKFWVEDLCDVFLESYKTEKRNLAVLVDIILKTLQVMHPFMPFITENLYQHIRFRTEPGRESFKSILSTPFPDVEKFPLLRACDPSLDGDFSIIFDLVHKIRWFKQYFFVNREPIVKKILIISNKKRLEHYSKEIEASIRIPECELGFLSLYDVYKLDNTEENWYCFPVKSENSTEASACSEEKTKQEFISKSLESDEIYIAFQLEPESLYKQLELFKFRLKKEKIESLTQELKDSHCRNFTKNFKKLTKINV